MKAFSHMHPVVLLVYYIAVIGFSMVILNPVCLAISLICAFVSSVSLDGGHKALFTLKYVLPIMLLTAVINPAFNHEGMTILTYLKSGNPLTLESIAYGIAAGVLLASVVCHFSCFNSVMTSDKLVYLFGRIIPSLSLVFSMTLRMIPCFIGQMKMVSEARKCMGRGIDSGSLLARTKNLAAIISIMVTWALESSIKTADSMKSRGYGLKGRTAFSLFRFDKRDAVMLVCICLLGACILYGYISGAVYWRWFPSIKGRGLDIKSISVYGAYAALMLLCPFINVFTELSFKRALGGNRP